MNELDELIPTIEFEKEEIIEQQDNNLDPVIEETPKTYENGDSTAITFFEELKTRGYTDENFEFDGTWEKLDEYLETFPQKVLDSVVASLPDVSKDVMMFISTAGENITKDEMKNFFKTYFEQDEMKDISTADEARDYLHKIYTEQGLTKRAVEAMLDDLEDENKLEAKAKEFFDKEKSKTQKIIESKKEEVDTQRNQIKQKALEIENELQATKWKPERINTVKQVLSNNSMNQRLKDIVQNPKTLIQFADIISYYNPQTKEFKFDNFIKQLETPNTLSVKERIERNLQSSPTVNTKTSEKNPNTDFLNSLQPILD